MEHCLRRIYQHVVFIVVSVAHYFFISGAIMPNHPQLSFGRRALNHRAPYRKIRRVFELAPRGFWIRLHHLIFSEVYSHLIVLPLVKGFELRPKM